MVTIPVEVLVYVGVFVSAAAYTVWLSWAERRARLVTKRTWLTVVLGTGLVLLWLLPLPDLVFWKVWLAFAVAGAPVLARSWWRELAADNRTEDHLDGAA